MVSSLQVGVGFLCLLVTICCVYAEQGDYEKLVRALAHKSSDRQFISTIKKWFSRSSHMEEMKVTEPTKTKIKYLPVYVPYPVQAPINTPPTQIEYYGAYQDSQKKTGVEAMYQGVHVVPNSHVQDYYLPFSGKLPVVVKRREPQHYVSAPYQPGIQIPAGYGYGNTFNMDAFEAEVVDDDSSEYDSEVIENAALLKVVQKDKTKGSRVRKVRRKETTSPRNLE